MKLRYDWELNEIHSIYNLSLPDLIFEAQTVHRQSFIPNQVQKSTLLSIKTGGCPENCSYCPQSAHHDTGISKHKLLEKKNSFRICFKSQNRGFNEILYGSSLEGDS